MSEQKHDCLKVIKLGGSILTGPEAYAGCARWLQARIDKDPQCRLVVIVSAQFGSTDALLAEAQEMTDDPQDAALDLLWSTGELRSVALLTMALHELGVRASGLNAHECGLYSPSGAREAGAIRINTLHLRHRLALHPIVVVPGFLARAPFDTLVTLGRGGSDLTAVLLAAGLGADSCDLVKDVPGYFTADPHAHADARPIPRLTYAEALRMAAEGCELVQPAALEAAARTGTQLVVRAMDDAAPRSIVRDSSSAALPRGEAHIAV